MYKPQKLHLWTCHELSMAFIVTCTDKLSFNSFNNRPRSSSSESVSPHTTSIIHLLSLLSFLSDRLRLQNKEFIRKCNYVASVVKGPGKSRLSKSKDIGLNSYFGKGKSHPQDYLSDLSKSLVLTKLAGVQIQRRTKDSNYIWMMLSGNLFKACFYQLFKHQSARPVSS